MRISVIIPTLNEGRELPETLARLSGADEIVIADGGSVDGTQNISGAKIVACSRGRSLQMNAGAAQATGAVFLFLHADTWLQQGCLDALRSQISDAVGGAFERRFRCNSAFLQLTCALATLRNRAIGWHLGDQAIFCRATTFHELGGFSNMRAFEDVDFSRRLSCKGKLVTLRPPVLTSARRFEEGAVKRTAKDLVLTMRYLLRPETFRV